jgi:bifunctional UDP-N-acetylglucosamine pyrophosphorylase/glucosamine-1-phosphate N-acetyltransferase
MTSTIENNFGAIILAAGRGKRMQAKSTNKVVLSLADKPLILHSIHTLEAMYFKTIVVVVGFAKASVQNVLKDSRVLFAEQKKRLGTAHALKSALAVLPSEITEVLVIQGDDSAFYKEDIIKKLAEKHKASDAALTMLTIDVVNPHGLGRIVRDASGEVVSIIEEKDATDKERAITEINPACYLFKVDFLKKYLPTVKKSPITGEYYLTSLIHIAMEHHEKLATVQAGAMPWRGVNTKEELEEAERLHKILVAQ